MPASASPGVISPNSTKIAAPATAHTASGARTAAGSRRRLKAPTFQVAMWGDMRRMLPRGRLIGGAVLKRRQRPSQGRRDVLGSARIWRGAYSAAISELYAYVFQVGA
jgi:hypothetical protein